MTRVTRDNDSPNINNVPVGLCNLQRSVNESKYEDIHQNALTYPAESISRKEPSKISEKKIIILYIFPGAPTLLYQQGNLDSCTLSSLALELYYMGDEYASKFIVKQKQKYFLEIHNKGRMHFCRDILMGHHQEKNEKIPNYRIKEWHTSTPYEILRNKSNYPAVCLLLDMWHRTDCCITVFSKWIFDSNLKVALSLTQVCLNDICCGNDTDDNKFADVLYVIREVPPEVVQRILNMK